MDQLQLQQRYEEQVIIDNLFNLEPGPGYYDVSTSESIGSKIERSVNILKRVKDKLKIERESKETNETLIIIDHSVNKCLFESSQIEKAIEIGLNAM